MNFSFKSMLSLGGCGKKSRIDFGPSISTHIIVRKSDEGGRKEGGEGEKEERERGRKEKGRRTN